MKTCIMSILMGAVACFGAESDVKPGDDVTIFQSDTRVVNGIKVDLMPVHQWLQSREGERPMKHWRQLLIIQIKPDASGWGDLCVVKDADGGMMQVHVKNIPLKVKKYIQRINELKDQIGAEKSRSEMDERVIREADAVVPIGVGGPLPYVEEQMEQRRQVNLGAERVRQRKEDTAKLQAEYRALLEKSDELGAMLAMFTGQLKSKIQVWDCGKVAASP